MASYVSKILSENESVQLKAKLHWIGYLPAFLWLAIVVVLLAASEDSEVKTIIGVVGTPSEVKTIIGVVGTPIVIVSFLSFWIKSWTTELAVTDRRVVAKTGVIARDTNELNLEKIEGVDVRQSVLGRLLDYGTISVRGTGGAIAPIPRVGNPIAFRKAVHAE